MAKKLGNDYRLWIESATPGTYAEVKGGQDLSVTRNGATIDTSTKDDFPYGTSAPGLRQLSVAVSLIPNLPDTTGYTRLETQAEATSSTPINFQIRKGGSSGVTPGDVVLAGAFYITDFNTSFGQNDAVKSTFTLVASAAPTTDVLA